MNEIRISLSDADFAALVNGQVVEKREGGQTIKIILSDIGFDRMIFHITDAANQ